MVITLTSVQFASSKNASQIELSAGDNDNLSPAFYLTYHDRDEKTHEDIDIEMGFDLEDTKILRAFLQIIIERNAETSSQER